jgi:hypothetical protein
VNEELQPESARSGQRGGGALCRRDWQRGGSGGAAAFLCCELNLHAAGEDSGFGARQV